MDEPPILYHFNIKEFHTEGIRNRTDNSSEARKTENLYFSFFLLQVSNPKQSKRKVFYDFVLLHHEKAVSKSWFGAAKNHKKLNSLV